MTAAARPKHTKRDANHTAIVKELRRLGFRVTDTADLGGEVLDLFVGGYRPYKQEWQWLHVEIKPPGKGKDLTEGERKFLDEWSMLPAIVAEYVDDIVDWFLESPD